MQLLANAALEQTAFDPNEMVLWLVHFQAKENSKEDEASKERFKNISSTWQTNTQIYSLLYKGHHSLLSTILSEVIVWNPMWTMNLAVGQWQHN